MVHFLHIFSDNVPKICVFYVLLQEICGVRLQHDERFYLSNIVNMENLGIGIRLMIVGMCTVFLILGIVIQLGKAIIGLVNRFAPAEEETPKKKTAPNVQPIDATTHAVLAEAVRVLTGGKGHVTNVKKL